MVSKKLNINQIFLSAGATMLVSLMASTALAQSDPVNSDDIEADAQFRRVLTITGETNLDFTVGDDDLIDFVAAGMDNTDFIRLATTGAVTFNTTDPNFSGNPTGAAGAATVNGEGDENIVLSCNATAIMEHNVTDNDLLNITEIRINHTTGGQAWGGANDYVCVGLSPADPNDRHPFTLDNTGVQEFRIGAQIEGKTGLLSGRYRTDRPNGTHITLRVQYP